MGRIKTEAGWEMDPVWFRERMRAIHDEGAGTKFETAVVRDDMVDSGVDNPGIESVD